MKNILILNGSPRSNGYTKKLIDFFIGKCEANVDIIDCHKLNIQYCIDCRHCEKNFKCSIDDEMQIVYKKLEDADVIVFATPIYFYSVTSQLKKVIDRLQVYFFRHINRKNTDIKSKKGVLIAVGGAKKYETQFLSAEVIAKGAMTNLNCALEKSFFLSGTDNVNVADLNELKLEIEKYVSSI